MQDSPISIISLGLDLMLYGMGTVFTFLTLMVFVLLLLAKWVRAFPGPDETKLARAGLSETEAIAIDPAHLQVIEQAIQQLRQNN